MGAGDTQGDRGSHGPDGAEDGRHGRRTQAWLGSGRGAERPVPGAGLFSECYSHSEDRAFALLVRRNHGWSRTTCLHLAAEAGTKAFFAHDGVQVRSRPGGGGRGPPPAPT